jgi:CheY-like chemotaxis protein
LRQLIAGASMTTSLLPARETERPSGGTVEPGNTEDRDPVTSHIPVVASSANAMPRDIERGMEAGFFRYLTKPIKVKDFMDTLHAALEKAEKNPATVPLVEAIP